MVAQVSPYAQRPQNGLRGGKYTISLRLGRRRKFYEQRGSAAHEMVV
jgi:hypothetical protein